MRKLLLITLILIIDVVAASAQPAKLLNIRVGEHHNTTRFVFDVSRAVTYELKILPDQIHLNIHGIQGSLELSPPLLEGTGIHQIRNEVTADGDLRLVFDLESNFDAKVFPLKPFLLRGHRLVLDLHARNDQRDLNDLSGNQQRAKTALSKEKLPKSPATETTSEDIVTAQKPSNIHFGGTWEQEASFNIDSDGTQKFEATIDLEWELGLSDTWDLTAITRIRGDTEGNLGPHDNTPSNYSSLSKPWYNSNHSALSLRELYVDGELGNTFWRIGKQQIVWGQADGIKVLDVVNPQSFREFILDDFSDSRIPLWTANVEIPVGDSGSLQLLWIPDTTYHEIAEAGSPYALTSSRLVPAAPVDIEAIVNDAEKPDNPLSDSDAGFRYSDFVNGWDVTFNYLYHYQDFQIPYRKIMFGASGPQAQLTPRYKRNHLVGGTFSNVFGDLTLRGELAYNSDTFQLSSDLRNGGIAESRELASVIGADWQLARYDALLSAQWFLSHLTDYSGQQIERDQTEQTVSLLYRRTFSNEVWQLDSLGLYSLNYRDSLIQIKLRYLMMSNVELWLGGDFFSGDSDGIFGQFSNKDRLQIGVEVGF